MNDDEFTRIYQRLGNLREACNRNEVFCQRHNVYDTSTEMTSALSASDGDEVPDTKAAKHATQDIQVTGEEVSSEEGPVNVGKDEVGDESGELEQEGEQGEREGDASRTLSRLSEDVHKRPAAVALSRTLSRTMGISNFDEATPVKESPTYEQRSLFEITLMLLFPPRKLAPCPWLALRWQCSTPDVEKHTPPKLVRDARDAQAKMPSKSSSSGRARKVIKSGGQARRNVDSHLHSGHRDKGIAHLRAARAIRDADSKAGMSVPLMPVASMEHASALMPNQLFTEVRSRPLLKWHTGQGTTSMRAARRLSDATELVTTGTVAKAFGCIEDKVVVFIDVVAVCKSAEGTSTRSLENAAQ
ncbi:hypothetical protein ON010_g13795 [Phytophthora cinnamomi]|nr:hypothetical protein ON010_g13795 [Phytophthora cinnamomi]